MGVPKYTPRVGVNHTPRVDVNHTPRVGVDHTPRVGYILPPSWGTFAPSLEYNKGTIISIKINHIDSLFMIFNIRYRQYYMFYLH